MKSILIGIMAFTAVLFSNNMDNREIYLNINNSNLEVGFKSSALDAYMKEGSAARFKYDINYLNGDNLNLIQGSIKNVNKIEKIQGSELGIGIKAIYLNNSIDEYTFLPLTASYRYNLPSLMFNIPPVSIDSDISYAPNVLSFSEEVEKYFAYSLELNIEPINGVKIYTGYRNADLKYKNKNNKEKLFEEIYGGIKMTF